MGFLIKDNIKAMNVKLTSYGRKQLSIGNLSFTKIGIGDSEINYSFFDQINFDPQLANILRPKDKNPRIVSFIRQINSGSTAFTLLPTAITYSVNVVTKSANERGFFNGNLIKTTSDFVKQPDGMILISGLTGGTVVRINKAPSYLGNTIEPIVGDYLMVKWANPLITGGTVSPIVDNNIPILWYKINTITGTLYNNNLKVTLDRNSPDFNGQGSSIGSGCFIYSNSNAIATSGDSVETYYGSPFVSDFIDDDVFTFQNNGIIPLFDVPVWNMSLIYTEEIAGVLSSNKSIKEYYTKYYGGFVNYIERFGEQKKMIGVIHYTNNSPANNYGESLYKNTPVLELPTIMWHNNNTGSTIGLTLNASTSGITMSGLNTTYYNLVDQYDYVVGKLFNDLKLFIIEDQELLFAMSYKSNRNWTLPPVTARFNLTECAPAICSLLITSVLASGGTITINASNNIGMLLYSINGGTTYFVNNVFTGLTSGVYNISVVDGGVQNCSKTTQITLT